MNADRNAAFFSDVVLLVEGNRKRQSFNGLFQKIIQTIIQWLLRFLIVGEKNSFRYFMELFGDLNLKHIVIHDDDNNKTPSHIAMNNAIQTAKNTSTYQIIQIPHNIEAFLGIPKTDSFKKVGEAIWTLELNGLDSQKEAFLITPLINFSNAS